VVIAHDARRTDPSRFGAVEESAHFYETFRPGGEERFCTENTLYVALLLTRAWRDDPARFERLFWLGADSVRAGMGLQVPHR
jgi:hypothetical protein